MNKFLNEIYEQPRALESTLDYYLTGEGQERLEKLLSIWKHGRFNQVLFTGMGSSFFAPYTASCQLSDSGISSATINAGELLHYHLKLISKDVLLTCISQSGESFEVVKIIEKLNEKIKYIGITNEEKSTLALNSPLTLPSRAGKEEMTSTKTYVSTLLVLSIFTRVLTGKWRPGLMPEIINAIEAVGKMIGTSGEWLTPAMDLLGQPSFVQVIGRGSSYSTVLQGALMIMEASRRPAAGIFGGEFRHGPMEMIKKGFRAIVLAPLGATYEQGIRLAGDITKFGGRVLLITNSKDNYSNPDIFTIHIPCKDEYLFTIPAVVPLQFIVNQWAADEGNEPGDFTMGAKVTVTE